MDPKFKDLAARQNDDTTEDIAYADKAKQRLHVMDVKRE